MKFTITPRAVRILGYVIAVLLVLHLGGLVARFGFGRETVLGLVPMFDFDEEANVPSLFTSLLFWVGAGLAFLIGATQRRQGAGDSRYWLFLAVVFVFLGLDESVRIHEQIIEPLRNALDTSSFLYYAWVIPYGLIVLVFGLVYLRFVWQLPPRVRALIFLAGGLYVGGALGMELLGGYYIDFRLVRGGEADIWYSLIITLEETLEMVGLTIFIYALLVYVDTALGGIELRIVPSARADAPPDNPRATPEC